MLANNFIIWYNNEFKFDSLYLEMINVSENSPYHREKSVAIHTDMVISMYYNIVQPTWTTNELCGAFACAFHDVGKPKASQINGMKWKPERGHYLSFGGHEQISARMWEDWAAKNWKMLFDRFGLKPDCIYKVGWMIEHHLPWDMKEDKLRYLVTTTKAMTLNRAFVDFLMADTFGRMSDDAPEKRQKTKDWIEKFNKLEPYSITNYDDGRVLILPIAPSGSGKSTHFNSGIYPDLTVYSWDIFRQQWYGNDYAEAYKKSTEDSTFEQKTQKEFINMVKEGRSIYVDNTNLTRKRRRFYIDQARRNRYKIVGVLFPVELATVIARQTSRPDKNVPADAVKHHYAAVQYPQYGEVDEVLVCDSNLR